MSEAHGSSLRHPVVFTHIAVPDLHAAATFYQAALGWSTIDVPGLDGHTTLVRCTTGAKPNIGLVHGEPSAGGCSIYVLCDQLPESARRWVEAGGTVRESEGFADLGDRLPAIDPWGNELMLWSWAEGRGWHPDPS